jgi:hypothetical protein
MTSVLPAVLEHCNSIIQGITFVENYDKDVSRGGRFKLHPCLSMVVCTR